MRYLILSITFILVSHISTAQLRDTSDLQADNVHVYKSYEAIVAQAKKKTINIDPTTTPKRDLNYSYNLKNKKDVDFERSSPMVQPLSYEIDGQIVKDVKDATAYLAYGNYNTVRAGAAYKYYIEDWMEAGFKVDHHSTHKNLAPLNNLNSTVGQLYLSYFLSPRTKLGLEGIGTRRKRSLDAPLQDSTITFELPYSSLGAALNLSHTSFEKLGVSARTRISYDKLKHTDINQNAIYEKQFDINTNIIMSFGESVNLEVDLNYTTFNLGQETPLKTSDLVLRPRINYSNTNFNLEGGIELIKTTNPNFIFPIARLDLFAIVQGIDISVFTDSEYYRTSMHYMSSMNPYMHVGSLDSEASYRRSYNLQIAKDFGQLTPSLTVSYNDYINDVFFTNRQLISDHTIRQFNVETYDRKEINIHPEVSYNQEFFQLNLGLDYKHFLSDSIDVQYVPSLSVNFSASEKLFDNKLSLTQLVQYSGTRQARGADSELTTLNTFLDFGLRAEYRVSDTFSVFGEGFNLLDSETQVWNGVANYGRNFWGGLKVRF